MDRHCRRIVGWALADRLRAEPVDDALGWPSRAAIRTVSSPKHGYEDRLSPRSTRPWFHAPLPHRWDRGRDGRQGGACFDNVVLESFHATIKEDLMHRRSWPTKAVARVAVFEYIEAFCNRRCRHFTLGYLCPAEFENSSLHRQRADLATGRGAVRSRARSGRGGRDLEVAAVLAQLAALLEPAQHPVQRRRVNAELRARLAHRDPGPRADELDELLAALSGPRTRPAGRLRRRRAGCRRRIARARGPRRPATPRRPLGRGRRRRRRRRGVNADADAVGDLFELVVLGDGRLELAQSLGDTLLGSAKVIKNRHDRARLGGGGHL